MKITAISAAVALALSAASTFAAEQECTQPELEQARNACLGTVDVSACLKARLKPACHAALDDKDDSRMLPRVTVVARGSG